ncbi:hypothetical protein GCM10023196_084090 [Actinoallomurus vinaceus]|uniref:Uncharacterized protein n=1 Tax=Actinoallomurus vinaceus TaxID=1080074 RepID=A0ABP8UMY2_9ACTN
MTRRVQVMQERAGAYAGAVQGVRLVHGGAPGLAGGARRERVRLPRSIDTIDGRPVGAEIPPPPDAPGLRQPDGSSG